MQSLLDPSSSPEKNPSSFASDEFIEVYQPQKGGTIGEWVLVGQMGSAGAEAEIWRAHSATNANHEAIIKFYRYGHAPSLLPSVLQSLNQENIVKTLAAGTIQGRPYEVMEYFPERGLDRLLEKRKNLSSANTLRLLDQLTRALSYLNAHGLEHQNLAPSNILVRSTEPLTVALSGFGGAQAGGKTTRLNQTMSTLMYAAPELANGISSKASDWWSVGLIVLEALTGHHPFTNLVDQRHLHFKIAAGEVEIPENLLSPHWQTLFQGLLTVDYKKRWQEKEIATWIEQSKNPSQLKPMQKQENKKEQTGTTKNDYLFYTGCALAVGMILILGSIGYNAINEDHCKNESDFYAELFSKGSKTVEPEFWDKHHPENYEELAQDLTLYDSEWMDGLSFDENKCLDFSNQLFVVYAGKSNVPILTNNRLRSTMTKEAEEAEGDTH